MTPRVVRSRDEFVQLIRDRRDELQLTMETLDAVTGLADGLCSKLLAPNPTKGMGAISLKALLGALALGIAEVRIIEDPAQAKRMAPRWTKRKRPDFTKRGQLSFGTLLEGTSASQSGDSNGDDHEQGPDTGEDRRRVASEAAGES
ncbi:hypothetical protein CQ14_30995 [Bradyrhizobium lablabi]|uniref:Uncharacterized protein n=1 Tax=Bradyrhizobium lablabi TaxID=722472 RepID=A0A0R3MXH7_9BRAD|nr:hypothetical protein [Bradyrhizobium lablabi]KRR22637.1 hypothetical protein CQ14_30995 [Bradyrhizobium lablabi]